MLPIQLPDNSVIADTVAAVFQRPAYATKTQSVWDMILRWITNAFDSFLMLMAGNPLARNIIRWGLVIAGGLIVARILYAIILHFRSRGFEFGISKNSGPGSDPWDAAHRFATQGRYTDAAHALYSGLLATMARKGRVAIHDSKTAGDYIRELKRSESHPRFANQFGEFARFYETLVYGLGSCSADEYARLQMLAAPLIKAQA